MQLQDLIDRLQELRDKGMPADAYVYYEAKIPQKPENWYDQTYYDPEDMDISLIEETHAGKSVVLKDY